MAKRKPFTIDGELKQAVADARISDVVGYDVGSVLTREGQLIPCSEFTRVPVPEGFETNLSHINKGGAPVLLVSPA